MNPGVLAHEHFHAIFQRVAVGPLVREKLIAPSLRRTAHSDMAALFGMAVAFGVPVASAINIVTLKRTGAHVDLAPAVLLGALLSCAITLPLSLPFVASTKDVLLLAILGVFQLGIPCVMMVRASAHLTAPEVALLGLLEVLMGPLWSWLGAGETPGASTLIGGAIVLAALVANEIVPRRQVAPN